MHDGEDAGFEKAGADEQALDLPVRPAVPDAGAAGDARHEVREEHSADLPAGPEGRAVALEEFRKERERFAPERLLPGAALRHRRGLRFAHVRTGDPNDGAARVVKEVLRPRPAVEEHVVVAVDEALRESRDPVKIAFDACRGEGGQELRGNDLPVIDDRHLRMLGEPGGALTVGDDEDAPDPGRMPVSGAQRISKLIMLDVALRSGVLRIRNHAELPEPRILSRGEDGIRAVAPAVDEVCSRTLSIGGVYYCYLWTMLCQAICKPPAGGKIAGRFLTLQGSPAGAFLTRRRPGDAFAISPAWADSSAPRRSGRLRRSSARTAS